MNFKIKCVCIISLFIREPVYPVGSKTEAQSGTVGSKMRHGRE